MTNISKNLRRN